MSVNGWPWIDYNASGNGEHNFVLGITATFETIYALKKLI
jgi:hypothetical protein